MKVFRFLRYFGLRGMIASAIACLLGLGYALVTHSPITKVIFSSANLWTFVAMLVFAGLTGHVDMQARQERVKRAVLTTSKWNSRHDYEHMEDSVSFAVTLGISSGVPLLVWALTYFVF